jgi:glycosyltransferase involved in cell wall biosynthesis
VFEDLAHKCLTTLHGRLDLPELAPFFRTFPHMPLVSISDDQRRPIRHANWLATVHHGLPSSVCPFHPRGGDYLAFLGRISPEKRPERAIEIAKRAGIPLKIAAKVDYVDMHYFRDVIRPRLDHPLIEFIGEIDERQKGAFLGNALALLFPIDWPEPFGIVTIEAMSAGTPVITWPCGSAPEVIEDGASGFLVRSIEEAVAAVERSRSMSRHRVRQCFEARFTAARMANDYLAAYEALLSGARRRMLRAHVVQDRAGPRVAAVPLGLEPGP